MNSSEARQLAVLALQPYRDKSYAELQALIDTHDVVEQVGPSGTTYYIQTDVFWDDKPGGLIRVAASIHDGRLRAFFPLSEDFLLAPDGHFVGE